MTHLTTDEISHLESSARRDPRFLAHARAEVTATLEAFASLGGNTAPRGKSAPRAAASRGTPVDRVIELPLYPVNICEHGEATTSDKPVLQMKREAWKELKQYGMYACLEEPNRVLIYDVAGPAAALLAPHKTVHLVGIGDRVFLGDDAGAEICELTA
jgi:hypothetical protein